MKKLKIILAVLVALMLLFAFGCAKPGGEGGASSTDEPIAKLEIEKAEISGGEIVLTFNNKVTNFVAEDLKIQAFNSDWYSLKPSASDRVQVLSHEVATENGKTVVKFAIANETENGGLLDEFTAPERTDEDKALIISWADNALTWQIPDNGGWDKDYDGHIEKAHVDGATYITKGWSANGKPLGTIDNDGTYSEMRLIAEAYEITGEQKYLDSFMKGMQFLHNLQCSTGGFVQVYPKRGNYSDYVTFNDDAMVNVLIELESLAAGKYPYTAIATDALKAEAQSMIDKAIDYILKAQITVGGVKSAWCAQHDPVTYEPKGARDYELPSISGSESIGVIKFLLHQRGNSEAIAAAEAALAWFDDPAQKMENTNFDKNGRINAETGKTEYFYYQEGKTLWWRFYDLETCKGFFSDRTAGKFWDIAEIQEERRLGYAWSGNWPEKLLNVYNQYGYYANRIVVTVVASETTSAVGGLTVGTQIIL